ncbi:macrolide resistance MFS transporter Mrx(A) [Microlunatus panaciterrae]|uniref:Multidrug efflux pump Tap n=1 Tax=Microlunatus panaciterrae TaxID=400768 RepID=A0ABS2RJR2_9ACTN|nr:MFS transporter [Microlunatus panaciterrae]MBM7798807.1 MFS family permease [Microlunatus panaciterrae]
MTDDRRPLIALLVVSAIANIGTRVSAIAIPWFVLTGTGSATATGLVAAFELLPYVLVKALGGPVVDRIGQRKVSLGADLASALVIGAVPALHLLGLLSFPVLLALVAVGGGLRGPGDNAKHTSVPLVAEVAGVPLERVTGLFGAIERGSGLVAPGVAAAMIALVDAPGAIAVTAGCFALSAMVVAVFLPTSFDRSGPGTECPETAGGYLARLRAGFSFLLGDRLLLMLVLMIAVTNLIDVAKTTVLLPVWAQRGGHGVGSISLMLTCMAGFSMVSSLLASWLGPRLPRRLTYFGCFLIAGPAPFVVLGLGWPVWSIALVYCVAGFASGFLNPLLGAIFYERIPRPLLGRVSGLSDATAWAGMPFGGLVGAGLIALVGLSPTFLLLAGGYLLATMIPGLLSAHLFDPPGPAPAAPADQDVSASTAGGSASRPRASA